MLLNELIEELQSAREWLDSNGRSGDNPEVVLTDGAHRSPKNYTIDGSIVPGAQLNAELSDYDDEADEDIPKPNEAMDEYIYLFEGSEHYAQRYTPRAVLEGNHLL